MEFGNPMKDKEGEYGVRAEAEVVDVENRIEGKHHPCLLHCEELKQC